jgi:CheY-like chemotaxis protein
MEAGSVRILVIEDDIDQMRVLVRTLQNAGFQVVQAYGGADALRKVKMQEPDLILTDLSMPQMSGAEVIRAVKADPQTRHIPCVAVTAHMWDHFAEHAGQAGCDGWISKPFKANRLLEEISRHLVMSGDAASHRPPKHK